MSAPEPTPRVASHISFAICSHGSLQIRLHDAEGIPFATASMSAEGASDFLIDASNHIAAVLSDPSLTQVN